MTDAQEDQVMEVIQRLWDRHAHISSGDLSAIAKKRWIFDFEHCTTSRFAASASFRGRFLREHDCSMRTPTRKKKVSVEDPDVIQVYRDRISRAESKFGPDRVWNMDETGWKDIQLSGKTVARKGVESVPVVVHGNDKAQITAVCTISKSGRKLAPVYILRGTTKRCLTDFALAIGQNRATCSQNSWMDTTIMLKDLCWLHEASNDEVCALVMDSFGAHFPLEVGVLARCLEIELIPVPKGLTGQWQPLDRKCFGPLKRISQRLWKEKSLANPGMEWNHIEAAKLLEEAWALLSSETVVAAWDFPGGDDPEIDPTDSDEDEGDDAQDADPPFTMHDLHRIQEMDTSETGESEPPSDGVPRAQLRHISSMVQLSHDRTRAHQKEEDRVLPDPDTPFHDIQVPGAVFVEAEQTRVEARNWQTPPPKDVPPGTPRAAAFPEPSARQVGDPGRPIGDADFAFIQDEHHPVGGARARPKDHAPLI
jgi:hypothetical protein